MEQHPSFSICTYQCRKCSVSLYEEFGDDAALNKALLRNINSIEFLAILYQLYEVKAAYDCHINFARSSITCNKTILVSLAYVRPGAFGKTLALNLILYWNQICPSDVIVLSDKYTEVFTEKFTGKTNIEFLLAFKHVILEHLCIAESIFDYIRSQWKCKIKLEYLE